MTIYAVKFERDDGLLKMLLDHSAISTVGDNGVQTLTVERPEEYIDDDLVLYFQPRSSINEIKPIHLGKEDEYVLTDDITRYTSLSFQAIFVSDSGDEEHSNIIDINLRPSIQYTGTNPPPPPGLVDIVAASIEVDDSTVSLKNVKGKIISKAEFSGGSGGVGPPGEDGKSAYEVAVENGFIGSAQDWLKSLIGKDGQGLPGVDGVGIKSIERTSGTGDPGTTDTYTITYTNDETNQFTVTNGTVGMDGQDGQKGSDGREVELHKSDTHIQWRHTGESIWTNLVPLADLIGAKGQDGRDAVDGKDGKDGREIELRASSEYIQYRYSGDTDWQNLIALSELKGKDGITTQATESELGGIKAKAKTTETAEIAIDPSTGKLYAPDAPTSQAKWGDIAGALSDQADLLTALTTIGNDVGSLDVAVSSIGDQVTLLDAKIDTRLAGLHFIKLTQSEYDALESPDDTTLFIITPEESED